MRVATDGTASEARKKLSLNEPAIRKAQREAADTKKRIELSDAGCKGLMLRLTPAGAATWVLYVRDLDGKPRKFPLEGSFPDMSVAAARAAAMALHGKVRTGFDPISQKRERRATVVDAKSGIGTLRALLDTYEKVFASDATSGGKFLKSWKAQRQSIEHVFAAHLDKAVALLTAPDLQRTADAHGAKYAAALAVRCIRPVLKWAAKPSRGMAPAGLADIEPPETVQRRDRTLSTDELRALLPVLSGSQKPYAAAMRFMLMTLARREEVCQARWRDVDWKAGTWRIPVTKNGEPHAVPLPSQALDLLRARLPAADADGQAVEPDPDALIFRTKTGAPLGNWDREAKAILIAAGLAKVKEAEPTPGSARSKRSKVAKIGRGEGTEVVMLDNSKLPTRHDLRRTGATLIGLTGVAPHIIEAALNHVAIHNRLAATYNRSRYRSEVADALQALADQLDTIEKGGAKVIPLEARRA